MFPLLFEVPLCPPACHDRRCPRLLLATLVYALLSLAAIPALAEDSEAPDDGDSRPFPSFQVRDGNNRPVSSQAWIGKTPALVDFWATYCYPCRYTLPELQRIHEDYGDSIHVVGISIDGGVGGGFRAYTWATRLGITYELVHDAASEAREALGVHTVPVLFLVDADGEIVADWWGEPSFDEVRAALDRVVPGDSSEDGATEDG